MAKVETITPPTAAPKAGNDKKSRKLLGRVKEKVKGFIKKAKKAEEQEKEETEFEKEFYKNAYKAFVEIGKELESLWKDKSLSRRSRTLLLSISRMNSNLAKLVVNWGNISMARQNGELAIKGMISKFGEILNKLDDEDFQEKARELAAKIAPVAENIPENMRNTSEIEADSFKKIEKSGKEINKSANQLLNYFEKIVEKKSGKPGIGKRLWGWFSRRFG